jgi:hypothetical protein
VTVLAVRPRGVSVGVAHCAITNRFLAEVRRGASKKLHYSLNFARVLVHTTLSLPCGDKRGQNLLVKSWELVADKLSKAGWTWGCVATIDSNGRTIFVADAHRDDGKRYVVHADEMLTAFLELERITHELAVSALLGDDAH